MVVQIASSMLLVPFLLIPTVLAAPASSADAHLQSRGGSDLSQVYTKCKDSGQFALTFDDGPWMYQNQIVDELDNGGAVGAFFVNGQNYDCIYNYADALRSTFDKGHIIGSHTWSHADISKLSSDELHDELYKVEVALKKILGIRPKLFRPPYGSYNDQALRVLKERGYTTIDWSMDSGDSVGESASESEQEYRKQAKKFPAPGIGLNHETHKSTADKVVPKAIEILENAGYKLVSLHECIGIEPYEYVGGKTERDNSWKC